MNKVIHKINFEIGKDPHENPSIEINLMEPFEERGLKGERNLIYYCLMKIDGETLVIAALKPTLTFFSMEFFN